MIYLKFVKHIHPKELTLNKTNQGRIQGGGDPKIVKKKLA